METIKDLLPLDLGVLGTVTQAELAMPGVYDAILECSETGLAVEAFIVLNNAEEISAAAKRYGKVAPDHPDLLVYSEDETGNTRYIVGYEVFRYKILHHLPLLERETIRSIAAAGAEMYPDYFGRYPVPFHTPWGCTTRHKIIANGLYWLETEQCRQGLAVACPKYMMICPTGQGGWQRDSWVAPPTQRERCRDICFLGKRTAASRFLNLRPPSQKSSCAVKSTGPH